MGPIELRPVAADEVDALLACRTDTGMPLISADRYRSDLDAGTYRLEWTWVAVRDGDLLARALWWGPAGAPAPSALDCLFVDDRVESPADLGAALLDAGHAALRAQGGLRELPAYELDVPAGWRDEPPLADGVSWRREAAARAGLTAEVERRRFEWVPDFPLPPRSTRLRFRSADDHAFLAVFRRVAVKSLDLHTRRTLEALGAEGQAADDLDFYRSLPGRRDLWRLAFDAADAVDAVDAPAVGFIIPSRSAYDASVSYLGVVPEARGRGYVNDLLAEITHVHADAGAPRIAATTDATNGPMLSALARAGYRGTSTLIVLSAPGP